MIGLAVQWLCGHLGVFGLLALDLVLAVGFAQFISRLRE